MTTEREIFAAAAALPPAERPAYLDAACAGRSEVRARVEAWLRTHDADSFMEAGACPPEIEANLARLKPEEVGEWIGPYRLMEQIGQGGFGTVWVANQEKPVRRRVALKIIKLGMDTKEVIARFEQERQALALMDHPHIAKVLDAGATQWGRPFFVMELVRGIKITEYCDQANLPTAERLALFIQVCNAVQHAHQKGIIHRDLKPSNILVTLHDGVPVPKVIDFGVAKATQQQRLTDLTIYTQFQQMIGTPLYMSPEQADLSGLDIDTRADIYALGVVLYELLTGRTPVDAESLRSAGFDEMRHIIREQEPPRPSMALQTMAMGVLTGTARHRGAAPPRLIHAVSGDLDWIVMKALEKDRTRRYETANGLAMDVQRHLDNEPILARPPSTAYRLRKMVRRNKLAFAAGAAVAAALLAGIAASTWQAIRATRAESVQASLREKAEANEQRAVQEKEAARRALAISQIALADAAYRERDGAAMQAVLHFVPEDLRDSNWSYLTEKSDTSIATIRGQQGIACIVPHPRQAGVFAIVGRDHGVALLKLKTQAPLIEFEFQPGFKDRASPYYRLAFSADGERLAIGRRGAAGIVFHSARDGRKLAEWETPDTAILQFSPDGGQLLGVATSQQVNLWDATSGRLLWTQQGGACAAFHPGGQMVLVAFGAKLSLLNAQDGVLIRTLPEAHNTVTSIAIRLDGLRSIIATSNGFIRCVDLPEGRTLYEVRVSGAEVMAALAYTRESDRFVTRASIFGHRESLQVWDADSGAPLEALLGGSRIGYAGGLAVHPLSGELVADGFAALVWDLNRLRPKWRLPGHGGSHHVAFWKSDDWLFAPTAADIDLLDLQNADPVKHPLAKSESLGYFDVSVSADGRVAAVGQSWESKIGEVRVLRIEGRSVERTAAFRLENQPSRLELSPAGDRLWTGTGVVDATTGAELFRVDLRGIFGVGQCRWLSRREVLASVTVKAARGELGAEAQLRVWDAATGRQLRAVTNPSVINALAIAPDGATFAEAGADRIVRLRDARTLEVRREFRAHDGAILALDWHPTQPILASSSDDLTIKIWNLDTGRLLQELRGPLAAPRHLAFSPTGCRVACLALDRATYVWEPESLQP